MSDEREVIQWAAKSVNELGLKVIGISESPEGAIRLIVEIPKPSR